MRCVLLVAGHFPWLEAEVRAEGGGGVCAHLEGVPKALMPGPKGPAAAATGGGDKRILDYWWDIIKTRRIFSEVFIVTNADKFKHFERWATARDFPVSNLVTDGTTTYESRLGSVADLGLCLRAKNIWDEDLCVIAGDMLFQDQQFDLTQVVNFHNSKRSEGDTAIYYEMGEEEEVSSRGIVEICPDSNRILRFLEKPKAGETESRNASVVFYCFRAKTLNLIDKYLDSFPCVSARSMGVFVRWLLESQSWTVFAMKLPTGFQLIGHETTLDEYRHWLRFFQQQMEARAAAAQAQGIVKITKRAYARIGLMGNPSDGFYGKTISLSIKNFWAEVTIFESAKLVLQPHPLCDPTEFGSLADLHGISTKEGYLGGIRLLQATCKKFYHYCYTHGIALPKRNFTLKYDTNIPRQVGLAGSSAIVTAALQCLMSFFRVTRSDLPLHLQPQLVLEVEVSELRIAAGLQDRVVQTYEGLVHMDFARPLMEGRGFGRYERLRFPRDFPLLFLCYLGDPSDSGRIHSDVRERFDRGEEEAVNGMRELSELTVKARDALERRDWPALAELMNANFEVRRRVYGEQCLGQANLRMVEIGRSHGAACKFPGSGGAIVGLLLDPSAFGELRKVYEAEGFVVTRVEPNVEAAQESCQSIMD